MNPGFQLTVAEMRAFEKLKTRTNAWPFYRWVGLAGALASILVGSFGIFVGFHGMAHAGSPMLADFLFILLIGWTLLLIGMILISHLIIKWTEHQKDALLIKLIESYTPTTAP